MVHAVASQFTRERSNEQACGDYLIKSNFARPSFDYAIYPYYAQKNPNLKRRAETLQIADSVNLI